MTPPRASLSCGPPSRKRRGATPLPTWTEVPESPVSRPDLAERYPLILTTGGRIQPYFISNNRQIKSLRRQAPFPIASLHPDTAKAAGIGEGDWIWIENQRGRVTQKAHLEPLMDPRVVNAQMGWWYPEADGPGYDWDVSNVNVLTCGDRPHDPVNGAYQLRALLSGCIQIRWPGHRGAVSGLDGEGLRPLTHFKDCVLEGVSQRLAPLGRIYQKPFLLYAPKRNGF